MSFNTTISSHIPLLTNSEPVVGNIEGKTSEAGDDIGSLLSVGGANLFAGHESVSKSKLKQQELIGTLPKDSANAQSSIDKRVPQNFPMEVNGGKQVINFSYGGGAPADLSPFDAVSDPAGNVEVLGARIYENGGLEGSARYTKSEDSLPDLVFDPSKTKLSGAMIAKSTRWPNINQNIVNRVRQHMFSHKGDISFISLCTALKDVDAQPHEKMAYIQQLISHLIHKPKHEEHDGSQKRGGEYRSPPWKDEKKKLRVHAKRDIARAINNDNSIALPKEGYPLSEFVNESFGDCRPTNLLFAFGIKAAGLGGDNDVYIVNVRCAKMEKDTVATKIDDMQIEDAALIKDISALKKQLEAITPGSDEATRLTQEKDTKEKRHGELRVELANLAGDHTLIVMAWPPNVQSPDQSQVQRSDQKKSGQHAQELVFIDAFYGELHGLPIGKTSEVLPKKTREELREKIYKMPYKNRTFFAEKIRDAKGYKVNSAEFVQIRAFLPYPKIVG